jgi:glycosyltransferase involved in cell wall biosynthesis
VIEPDRGRRPITVLVEPNNLGHRLQWVAWVARTALDRGDEVVLVTHRGAQQSTQFHTFLDGFPIEVLEEFDEIEPPITEIGRVLLALHRERHITTWVFLDSDRMLKTWWRVGPRELASRAGGPQAILMMSRCPPRFLWTEPRLLALRLTKTAVSLLALARGRADRIGMVVGRDHMEPGRVLHPARDPAVCTAHSRDRAALRARLGLPADRYLLGILGDISIRKSVPTVFEAALLAGPDVDLLLAGKIDDEMRAWYDALPDDQRSRVRDRFGFLSDDDLDACVAASDVIVAAHLNPGPSGIMGKAMVAGVPSLTAASRVRRLEVERLDIGVDTELTAEAMAEGIRRLRARGDAPRSSAITVPTVEEFAGAVLGDAPALRPAGRRQ